MKDTGLESTVDSSLACNQPTLAENKGRMHLPPAMRDGISMATYANKFCRPYEFHCIIHC